MDFRGYVREHLPPLGIAREAEIADELAEHLDDIYQEARAAGLDHQAAWARAAGALPAAADDLARALRSASASPPRRVADRVNAALDEPPPATVGGLSMVFDLRRDLRYALRTLVRERGFTAAAVMTLALGIGAAAVIFSAVDALLLRSAPVAEPDRLVSVYTLHRARATANPAAGDQVAGSSYPDYVDLRDSGVLDGLAAYANVSLALDAGGVTERITGQIVTGNYFDVAGVRPIVGRTFAADEDRVASPVRVAVLSYRTWQQRFGGAASVIGTSIVLNGNQYTVIGVAPRGFRGIELGDVPEIWVPMALQQEVRPPSAGVRRGLGTADLLGARGPRWLDLAGRLRDGATIAETASALDTVGRRLEAAYPDSNRDLSATALPLGQGPGVRARSRPLLTVLAAAVSLVLLIACANVASLLLARAVTRRREVAVRMALGASRAQLVRQWLTEAVVLGGLGAIGGVILARWGVPVLYGLGIPATIDLSVNPRVLAFALATGIATALVFGLAPALQLRQRDTLPALREETSTVATGVRATRLRSAFVVLQVAVSLVLLAGAGLFIRTLQQTHGVDLGYQLDGMLLADVNLDPQRYSEAAGRTFYAQMLERLNAVPGIQAVAAARITVLSGNARTLGVSVDGQPIRPDRSNAIPVRANVVSDGYFTAMGIPVIRGRGFGADDRPDAPRVAIVSRALANRMWPAENPIGRRVVFSGGTAEVIGIVPDTVYLRATEREPRPILYVPLSQNYESGVSLHLRTNGDPLSVVAPVRQTVRDLDPQVVVDRPRRLVEEFERSIGNQRTMAMLVGVFSAIALLLAAVGLYGVMAYVERQRRAEVGLRLALGATPASVLTLTVMRGARLVATGVALGLAGAFAGARYIRTHLFGVEPTDPLTWLAVSVALILVGLLACAIPARRAMRTDPAVALRSS